MNFTSDYAMLIGGQLESGNAAFDVLNPANEEVIARAPDATAGDLDRAVAAARTAFPAWAATPIAGRKAALPLLLASPARPRARPKCSAGS